MRVLFLTHRLPYAPNRGDRIRSFHTVLSLVDKVELTIASLTSDSEESARADDLRRLGAEVLTFEIPRWANYLKAALHLAGTRPLTHVLLDAPGISTALTQYIATRPPDVVLAFCSGMARFAIEPPLEGLPFVVDLVDVDSAKWEALSAVVKWPRRWVYRREARLLSAFEGKAASRASCTYVVNEREAEILRTIAPQAAIRVIPVGVDVNGLTPTQPPTNDASVVFCGVMSYQPNIDAVMWFALDIWPRIRRARPDAIFTIVGSDPNPEIRGLASVESGIVVTGAVPDVRTYLWEAAVSVAPIRIARGVQTKVLEAVAAGLPAVVTPQVFEGLPSAVRPACRVAGSAETFAAETLALLGVSGDARRGIARCAELDPLTWDAQLAPLVSILTAAAGAPDHHQIAERR
jgi:sugar transferase (PEP-CTERM/EpsH1 system associated)